MSKLPNPPPPDGVKKTEPPHGPTPLGVLHRMMIIKCYCGATIESGDGNPGRISETTGWNYIMRTDGSTAWVCPECMNKLQIIAKDIEQILGKEGAHYLYFPSINKRTREQK